MLNAIQNPKTDLHELNGTDVASAPVPAAEPVQRKRTARKIKHCRQCFREDYHSKVKISSPMLILAMIFTLGIFYFFRPSRCTTCGTMRFF